MKSSRATWLAVVLFTAIVNTVPLTAQTKTDHKHHHYQLIDMGTFGGPESYFPETIPFVSASGDLSSRGLAAGGSATSASTTPTSNFLVCGGISGTVPFVFHAFEWEDGVVTDLGALAGTNNCSVPGGINAKGDIVGTSENGEIDPLIGINESRPVRWKDGQISELGSFGGYQGFASSINNHGLIVGASLNTTPDPFSIAGALFSTSNETQTRAFVWQEGVMRDLGTLGGPDAVATLVNEHGQIAGMSYTNSIPSPGCPGFLTSDPFLWDKGKMKDLGTLGGTCGIPLAMNGRGQVVGVSNVGGDSSGHPFLWPGTDGTMQDLGTLGGTYGTANAINEAGEVVGYASNAGDQAEFAFLWRKGALTNLGSLNGDPCSTANAINSRGQVVGISTATCDYSTGRRAYLWENGSMVDLNTLIPPNSGVQLTLGETINDRGEIAVNGTPSGCDINVEACGHAVLLIPCDDQHPGIEGCDYSMVEVVAQPPVRPVARKATPIETVTDDLAADHFLAPFLSHSGNCEVNQGKLTGICSGVVPPYYTCSSGSSSKCPKGATSRHTICAPCGLYCQRVDSTRSCTF
jgi:probable HAF family extracellular repeat protein